MKEIPLSGKRGKGKFVKVDDDLYEWAMKYNWCVEIYRYNEYVISRKRNQPRIYLHKEVVKIKKGQQVFFKNGDGLDCRRENLILPDDWKNVPMLIDEKTGAVKIPLFGKAGKGKYALVDREDWEKVGMWSWQLKNTGYATRTGNKNGKQFSMLLHRIIMDAPKDKQVDHINMNRLDDRRSNLRLCNNSQNNSNKPLPRNNTTGFRGVEVLKEGLKWKAKIRVNGKTIHSKRFSSIIEAAKEYDRLARKYHGEFAKTNF